MHSDERAANRQFPLFAIALLALIGTGCHTALQQAVARVSPQYEAKTPALGQPETGERYQPGWLWVPGQVLQANACYVGEEASAPDPSWTEVSASYSDAAGGDLSADFGPLFKAQGNASAKRKLDVVLKDLLVTSLEKVRFNPASTCGTDAQSRLEYERPEGRTDHVVTRAILAKTVDIHSSGSAAGELKVDTTVGRAPVKGAVTASADGTTTISGANLFFAHKVEKFRVSTKKFSCQGVAQGKGCAIDDCALVIQGSEGTQWKGLFACSDGSKVPVENRTMEIPEAIIDKSLPGGVSYSVRVSEPRVSSYDIEVTRWTVFGLGQ